MTIRRIIALIVAVGIPAGAMIWYRMHQTSGFAAIELIAYPLIFGGAGIVVLCLLQTLFLKQPLSDLNRGAGRGLTDVGLGLGLAVVYFVLFFVERATLADLLTFRSNQELLGLMLEMRQHPWMLVVWFGPVLWIGIALFEELVRVFLLATLASFSCARWWTAAAILIAAILVGLTHWSQGSYGIVTIALKSVVSGVFYLKYRRVLPLVLAHVLYDGLQVALLLGTYPEGT